MTDLRLFPWSCVCSILCEMKLGVSFLSSDLESKSVLFSDGNTFTINKCILLNLRKIPLMLLATCTNNVAQDV